MKILLVDDHKLFIDGLCGLLNGSNLNAESIQINESENVLEYVQSNNEIVLILTDLFMPHLDGIELIKLLRQKSIWIPIAAISATENKTEIQALLNAGIVGFIPKTMSSEEMLHGLRQILAGNKYFPKAILAGMKIHVGNQPTSPTDLFSGLEITPHQLKVLKLLAHGFSNKQIARQLNLSESTIKYHIANMLKLMHSSNRTDCILEAMRRGLLN